MKNLILFLTICTVFSSCSGLNTLTKWAKENGTTKRVGQYQITRVDNLYKTDKVKKILPYGTLTWDIPGASIELKTKVSDSLHVFEAIKVAKK